MAWMASEKQKMIEEAVVYERNESRQSCDLEKRESRDMKIGS